ncbi:MAG: hypothetical protein ABJA98_32100 [Acidobacteriota bacterium]
MVTSHSPPLQLQIVDCSNARPTVPATDNGEVSINEFEDASAIRRTGSA